MAISFEESVKLATANSIKARSVSVEPVAAVMAEPTNTVRSVVAAAEDLSGWTLSGKYLYYDDYSDSVLSSVDAEKNISLDPKQVNLTQETNSQYIPFQMPRYYDGFDLVNTSLLFHFVNREGSEGFATPVNVYYNDSTIRFAWLVDKHVTAIEGKVNFEIQAVGVNSKGDEYIWKTKPSDSLNILKSLAGNGAIEPDNSWMTSFLTQVTEQVALAQAAAQDARAAISEVEGYANEAASAAASANDVVSTAKEELTQTVEASVSAKVNEALANYYTSEQVDSITNEISAKLDGIKTQIENTDGLANFDVEYDGRVMTFYNGESVIKEIEINSDPSAEWTAAYTAGVDEKINSAKTESQASLDAYKEIIDADLASIHEDIDGLPETLATDYYNKIDADDKFATKTSLAETNQKVSSVESSANANKEDIGTLSAKVVELQADVDSVDKSPRLTYDVSYNTDGDYMFKFYEIENEGDSENEVRTEKATFIIQGGGGGTSSSSVLKIEYVTKTPITVTVDDRALITYIFSGTDSSGDEVLEGTATWKVGNTTVATQVVTSGENTFDITEYIAVGTQKVTLSIIDDAGSLVTKRWTVQKLDVRLESTFNDKLTYPVGTVSFNYTPYGAISKEVHFALDGKEIDSVNTTVSGIPMAYDLTDLTHGSHLLDVYMTADVNGGTIKSNHVVKDIIVVDSASTDPIIGCTQQKFTARQYDTTNIVVTVYHPTTETPTVTIKVDGSVVSTQTLTESTFTYPYKTDVVGEHTITIICDNVEKALVANITKLDINIAPVTAGLVFDFNPSGKSNNDADRVWTNGAVSMSVSDNFDWINGGYQFDSKGDQYFCIKAGTSASIDYLLFADDAKRDGKEFKLVFKTTNVAKPDATFLSCVDNTTGSDHIGIRMDVQEAYIYGQAGSLHLPYSEEDIIEFEFNINRSSTDDGNIPMVMGYEDGVSTRPLVYDDSYNFTQNTPKVITLGSEDCDLHIYRLKVYNKALDAKGILSNFIADARNAEEMVARYNRNQIYDENQALDPDVLAEKCPWLRVYKLSAPYFTNNKSDKVPGTTIQQIYKNGDPKLDNWTCYNAMHSGQGTSSNNYGAAGRNLDFIMNKSGIDGVKPKFILGDGSEASEITMARTSVPVAYLNAKVNIASSNNMTNAMLANRYNQFNPYKRPFVRDEGVDTSFIKDTMEFFNCVIFIQETNDDLSTHREFADKNWHFYAIGNIGDSKKTDDTRLTDMDDKYECCVEIMDVELPLSDFPTDTMMNAMGYKVDEKTEEKIYTWAKDENLGILYEKIDGEYTLTQDTSVDLNKTYYVDILEHDDFSEDYTYGWRYLYEGDDKEENAEVAEFCHQKWNEFYRFVTTSSDEDFKAHLSDYFVVDSALYYYLFTTRYCMVDNRAKNSFWHYGKTGEVDAEGNPIRKWDLCWDYDNDTALGLNNYGKQVYRYGLEDTDVDEKGEEVFRESDSTFFCRLRDLFSAELKSMFNTLESQNAWHAESFINQADEWQSEFPEELWRIDIERKYIRTYNSSFISGAGDSQFLVNMANGKMKYHRRQWERSQEKYMASKYQSSVASSDNAILRCTVPNGDPVIAPNYRIKLTPYAYMYLNVKYGTQNPIQLRAEPNIEYEIPFEGSSADIVDIYSSSLIQSFGDLSTFYPATVDTSKASKIKELIIGNETDGYDNPSMTTLTTGANYLLETLNIENVSGLTQALNLTALNNLRELYAHGSNIGGATFADGGKVEIAELPAINSFTIKNLIYLTTFDIADLSKLTTLTVENCDTVDLITILDGAENVNRVRIIGIEWNLENTDLLERLFNMKGIDKDGYNVDASVLSGSVYVPTIRQQRLYEYNRQWPDLAISYGKMIEQYPVTFINDDGSVLEIQYVDKGSDAIDPTTRSENPLIPIKESSISHDYTFAGWDSPLTAVFSDRTVTATYSESLRRYTIKYVSKGTTVMETSGLYGENIPYSGESPVYTAEESAYVYYLFNRWDKSGFIDGDKVVNAIFDKFEYTSTAFDGKELSDLSPVEIYAMNKLNLAESIIEDKDAFTFTIGNDVEYDDIESENLISEKTVFDGKNYIDTGIALFDEDRDFVLAIDYEFYDGNKTNAVLAQCFQANGSNGFKLWYSSSSDFTGGRFTWGTTHSNITTTNKREVVVVRHKKGDNNLTIYNSNLDGDNVSVVPLERTKTTSGTGTLVFGCARADDGIYENHCLGEVNWCKLWYKDLGDEVCQSLAVWPHEKITLEACGFRKYYLTENTSKRCSFSLLASHLLGRTAQWSSTNSSRGGWKESALNASLNNRLYHAIPAQIRALIKQVRIPYSLGEMSSEIDIADCYITVPSCIEMDPTMTGEPYVNEGTSISYLSTNESRKRAFDGGDYAAYWLRSPNVAYESYVYQVEKGGSLYGYSLPNSKAGVLIEISF